MGIDFRNPLDEINAHVNEIIRSEVSKRVDAYSKIIALLLLEKDKEFFISYEQLYELDHMKCELSVDHDIQRDGFIIKLKVSDESNSM